MPKMRDRERSALREMFRQQPHIVLRTVIGDDQFEIPTVLVQIAFQQRRQRIGPVVGGDDDGNLQCGESPRSISLT